MLIELSPFNQVLAGVFICATIIGMAAWAWFAAVVAWRATEIACAKRAARRGGCICAWDGIQVIDRDPACDYHNRMVENHYLRAFQRVLGAKR